VELLVGPEQKELAFIGFGRALQEHDLTVGGITTPWISTYLVVVRARFCTGSWSRAGGTWIDQQR
jgi:hypothetical protein